MGGTVAEMEPPSTPAQAAEVTPVKKERACGAALLGTATGAAQLVVGSLTGPCRRQWDGLQARTVTNKDSNQEVEIARCQKGQYFGELALVTNKPRAASAYAVGEVKCLVMDIQAFERLLGPCMDIMKRNITHYEEQLVALFGSNLDLTDPGN
uniref:cAMP-dependent protein kinase type II-alpha regulatory subunit n=1 Tax=Sphaerodactylus townsendi TaxID=933632 RepID=A0ACB8EH05_9SAUR